MQSEISDLNSIILGSVFDSTVMNKQEFCRESVNDCWYEKDSIIKIADARHSYACQIHNSNACLSLSTIQEMIQQLLCKTTISKDELAKDLGITVEELELLIIQQGSFKLRVKINLPLIRLYCKKWPGKKS